MICGQNAAPAEAGRDRTFAFHLESYAPDTRPMSIERSAAVRALVHEIVADTPVYDIHTHLYDPAFGGLLLWGIDELLTYHYLVAESLRWLPLPYEQFFALPKAQQAEAIWNALFIEHSPVSEACR